MLFVRAIRFFLGQKVQKTFLVSLCCPSSDCSKDSDGVPSLVPHIFVEGENTKKCKEDSGSTKKVPEKCFKRGKGNMEGINNFC